MKEWIESLDLWAAITVLWAVGILRTSIMFSLGHLAAAGGARFQRIRSALEHPIYRKAQAFVNRWGALAVPACFFTVGFQTAVIVTTGFTKMPLSRWIPAMLVGTFIWGVIYGTVGMAAVWAWLERPWIATPIILIAVILVTVRHFYRKKARRTGNVQAHDTI